MNKNNRHSIKSQKQPAAEDTIFDVIINHDIDENVHRSDAEENPDVNTIEASTADAERIMEHSTAL